MVPGSWFFPEKQNKQRLLPNQVQIKRIKTKTKNNQKNKKKQKIHQEMINEAIKQ